MTLTLRLLAILGLFALSTLPFAMAADEEETVIVDGGTDGDPVDSDDAED